MKKKDNLSKQDQKDWQKFIEDTSPVPNKDKNSQVDRDIKKFKFDLHGFSLNDANKKVEEIIMSCSRKNVREILLITGKGLHSNTENVYSSSKLNKLRYSVPEFINSKSNISTLVTSISNPPEKDGGEGAILIRLKKL